MQSTKIKITKISFSASLDNLFSKDLNGQNQIYLFQDFSIPCSKQFHLLLPPFFTSSFIRSPSIGGWLSTRNFEQNRDEQELETGTGERDKKGVEEMEGIEEIRSLESRTNMSASSVPVGVIDRLRFLLSPSDPWLRNILQEQFFS